MLSLSNNHGKAKEFYYSLFSQGIDECIDWPFYKTPDGYGTVRLDRPTRRVNRNICYDLYGEPKPGDEAAHSCGNPSCCNPKHLSWKTPLENAKDKKLHGREKVGEEHYRTSLTEGDVIFIRENKNTLSQRQLARMFGITKGSVHYIQKGLTWKHI